MKITVLVAAGVILIAGCSQDASENDNGDAAAVSDSPAAAPAEGAESAEPAAAAVPALERRLAPPGAAVYFIEPEDGAVVSNPVRVVFGLKGAGVAPAGIEQSGTGHHHLLVDTGLPDLDAPVPADDNHIHFGGGQTETEIELESGEHSLQLLVGDERHVPHEPPIVSDSITIEVR